MAKKDLSGLVFNNLQVIGPSHRQDKNGIIHWWAICACGNLVCVRSNSITTGNTKSCGCLKNMSITMNKQGIIGFKNPKYKHGKYKSREYKTWASMKGRCLNKKNSAYCNYGGRGITVCERWMNSFENFLMDMGEKPTPNATIERRNNDKGYSPENCYWSCDWSTQSYNKRTPNGDCRGVSFRSDTGKWRARISKNYKEHALGCFDTFYEAKKAWLHAAKEFFGQE